MRKKFSDLLLTSTAITIAPALAAGFFMPTAAQAQTTTCGLLGGSLVECVEGTTGTVTGTASAGSVLTAGPGLVVNSATDLIVNVTGQITTELAGETGVLLNAADDVIFTLDGTVRTLGDGADGVNITGSSITADLGSVFTQGVNAQGVELLALDGPITVDVDAVQTDGDLSGATVLRGTGDIRLTANALSTSGTDAAAIDIAVDPAVCVTLAPSDCDITAAAESVTTEGFGGIGALIAATGDTDVNIGVLRTGGDQAAGLDLSADPTACVILGAGACGTRFTVGSLTTEGDDSPGALVRAAGDIDGSVGILETNGDRAIGLDLASDSTACAILGEGACDTSFTVGTLTTQGAGATGVLVRAAGDTTGNIGILETNGDDAFGIDIASDPTACVIVGVGACDVGLVADEVTTNGNQAAAVLINTVGDITADLGLVSTGGANSPGVTLITNPAACLAIGPGSCVIQADVDEVDTDGPDSPGVVVDGGSDPIDVEVGEVDTDGDNSPGVDVEGTGPITVVTGPVNTDGDNSPGVVVDGGEGPINVDVAEVDTDGDNSPGIDVEGTGPITVVAGPVNTGGDNSPGIIIDGDDGAIDLTCASVITASANSPAVMIGAVGSIGVQCGQLTTGGDNSDGLTIDGGAGPITVSVGGVTTAGADSDGVQIDGTGTVAFTNRGTITTTGQNSTGILVTGPIAGGAINCGNVSTAGANSPAVDVTAMGNLTVTCGTISTTGMNSDGILVVNGAGTTTVTAGSTTTTGPGSIGIDVATAGTGAVTVNTGTVSSTGPGSLAAVRVVASGCAPVSVNVTGNISSGTGDGVNASSACAVTVTTASGTTVQGATGGIDVTSGTTSTINVNGTVQATGAGAPAIMAAGGPATVNIGSTGRVTGSIMLTGANDLVNNAGMFDVMGTSNFGAGTDVFNNMATGTVRSTAGAGVLANCETFNNAGTVTMINGAANNTLSLCGNYVGTGNAALGIDFGSSANGLIADRLIIGGSASGSTAVNLNRLDGTPIIDTDGVLIVDAASAAGTPFTLQGETRLGLINFGLRQQGGDTFLFSAADEAVFDVGVLPAILDGSWHASTDAALSCAAARRNDFGTTPPSSLGLCGQLYGGRERFGDNDRSANLFGSDTGYSDRTRVRRIGGQFEIGYRSGGYFSAGLTAGYEHANADMNSGTGFTVEGHNLGLFAQLGSTSGFYGGVIAKRSKYNIKIVNPLYGSGVEPDATSTGFDGEVGWRTPTMGAMLDLNAGLSHVRTKMDDFQAGFINFGSESFTSTRGRLGARLGWSGNWAPFVAAKVFHDFGDDPEFELGSGAMTDTFTGRRHGTWGRLEAGLGGGSSRPILSGWVDVGDVKGIGVRAGVRF